MSHPQPVTLVQTLADRTAGTAPGPDARAMRVPVAHYTDKERFEREFQRLFLDQPLMIAHESQLPEAGDTLVQDWLGLPMITMRDTTGVIATFMNVCRHRGMRLLEKEGVTNVRSLVCPYHHWTYGLDGDLRKIPRQEVFSDVDPLDMGLVPIPTEVRNGLIWIRAQIGADMELDTHLAGLGRDLDTFDMSSFHFCQQSIKTVGSNWKLVQDAFLDGYHVTRLHSKTVGPFFPDAMAESDSIGKHIRSAVARNEIAEAVGLPQDELDLRKHVTFSYTVFPSAVLVFQPDYTSIITLFPQSHDKTLFIHTMLTPKPPQCDEEQDHFRRSFELIDKGVFEAEDIFVAVGAQRGMLSGTNDHLLFGGLEEAAIRFHKTIASELKEASTGNQNQR